MSRPVIFVVLSLLVASGSSDYWDDRKQFLKDEAKLVIGSKVELTETEEHINQVLMKYKLQEYDYGFANPGNFSPARHFFHSKENIEHSPVYQFIKELTKGAALHTHLTAASSFEVFYNITFMDNLYYCEKNGGGKLKFLPSADFDKTCSWELVADLRKKDPNFDKSLKSQVTLVTDNPRSKYPDINAIWVKFMKIFDVTYDMLGYTESFRVFLTNALQEYYDDHVLYCEFRSTFSLLYDLSGRVYNTSETLAVTESIIEDFKKTHKNFIGAKIIFAPVRRGDNNTMEGYIEEAIMVKRQFPNFIAGFDLVGQEDLGQPLTDFINSLQKVSREMPLLLHAGESSWQGSSTDLNIIDAIILGAKRIGHGYSIAKHPKVINMLKKRDIGVEVCPISNQVLMLVDDIRNHPGAMLIANNVPVIISNDDPTFFGSKALSHDWYMAFMAMTPRDTDLRFFIQIALNSIKYSSLNTREKDRAFVLFNQQWQANAHRIKIKYLNG